MINWLTHNGDVLIRWLYTVSAIHAVYCFSQTGSLNRNDPLSNSPENELEAFSDFVYPKAKTGVTVKAYITIAIRLRYDYDMTTTKN